MIIGFGTHIMPEMAARFFFLLFSTVQHPKIWSFAKGSTERWGSKNLYCPVCGEEHIARYENNKPVADYFCKNCGDDFELKSKQSKSDSYTKQIPDGAYHTMIERITSNNNPHLLYLQYALNRINNLSFVPKLELSGKAPRSGALSA
jgi:predicted RNA-binding Zn-ribbon protein involved in translation (DUF1610 family)